MDKSLAQFVIETREKLGLSQIGLMKKSGLTLIQIDLIESGQELFLASTIRQKLAKGLKINPKEIKLYEKTLEIKFDELSYDHNLIESIKKQILDNCETILCPNCSSKLDIRIAKLYDLEDNLILHPKAKCMKCPFQIK